MKEVYMEAIIRPTKDFDEIRDDFSFNGGIFCINEKYIPFDFEGWRANIFEDKNGQYIQMRTKGAGLFFDVCNIDYEVYKDGYKALGLENKDITAEFLAAAEKILKYDFHIEKEFEMECNDYTLESVAFSNELGNEYSLPPKMIADFNQNLLKQY